MSLCSGSVPIIPSVRLNSYGLMSMTRMLIIYLGSVVVARAVVEVSD